jgi:hypothetical protein
MAVNKKTELLSILFRAGISFITARSRRFTTQPNFSLVFLWPAGRGGKKVELNDCTKQKEKPIQVIRIFPAFLH